MAKASTLANGTEVLINQGHHEGAIATVIDSHPIPDGGDHRTGVENQRKVLVSIKDSDGQDFETYMLPRMLDHLNDVSFKPVDISRYMPTDGPGMETRPCDLASLTSIDGSSTISKATKITDPMDPALDRFRPPSDIVKRYVSRMVPGGYTDIDFLLTMRDQRDINGYSPNIALVGDTQSGKTMLVQVLAVLAALRDGLPKPYPVFTINGSSGVTSYDIYGQTTAVIIDGREVLVWMNGLAQLAADAGGFLYLDEWNAVPPAQGVALHPLLDDRRQFVNTQKATPDGHGGFGPEVVKANTALWVISTINPGLKGTQILSEATSNRFRWLEWNYDEATERELIPSKTVRLIGGRLREALTLRTVTVPVGTSVLQRLNADCAMFGVDNAIWTFQSLFPPNERPKVEAIIGDGGLLDLLREEYPEAMYKPGMHDMAVITPGSTWDDDSISHQV